MQLYLTSYGFASSKRLTELYRSDRWWACHSQQTLSPKIWFTFTPPPQHVIYNDLYRTLHICCTGPRQIYHYDGCGCRFSGSDDDTLQCCVIHSSRLSSILFSINIPSFRLGQSQCTYTYTQRIGVWRTSPVLV